MGKLAAQKHNRRHLMIISFIFYVIVGDNEALVNKIEVLVNDMVSIHCYTNAPMDIQWHFNSKTNFLYAGRRFYQHGDRMRLENNTGTYILLIPEVMSEDAGWYYCSEELTGRLISSTHLTVLYSDPVCYSNMHPKGFIGPNTCNLQKENMAFSCVVSFYGNSPPHLMWRLLNDNRSLNSSICEDKPNRRNCSLILTSDPKYDGSIFICQTTALMDSRFNCSTEAIKILYFSSTNDIAKKYVNDNVNCSANSNLNVKYNWALKQNNKTAFLSSSQTLVIQKPGIYQCEVNYSIRNYSCISIASVMNVSVESTNGGTTSGTTTTAIVLSTVLVFAVFPAGIILICWIRKRIKRKRESKRIENERRENERRENERRENERRENERIRNKIEGMYKDFVSKVNAMRVVDLLVQKHIISNEDGDNVRNKGTREDKCRALLDHVFSSSHGEAFIVLKKAISVWYPSIVARIDANYSDPVITIQENERIKDKVVSMYIDFTSEVDPKNIIFDLLIQNRIVSMELKRELMSKDTANERCRALIDHLLINSKENAFIVLQEALKERYPNIVTRIDASDAENEAEYITIAGKQENERIRNRVVAIYEIFVSEVDPKKVADFLIQNKIVNVKQIHHLKNQVKTEDHCRALLDLLFSCFKDNVFIILKEALKEHYPGIVKLIDSPTTDDERSTMRLENSIIVFGKDYNISSEEIGAFKINLNHPDEVSVLQQLPFKDHFDRQFLYMAAPVYCGSVFLTGIGVDGDEIWRFDAKYTKWNKCATMIKGRSGHCVAFVDHILYICGGRKFSLYYYDAFDDVEAYDTIDDKCSAVGKLNYAVFYAGNCVPYKASLYIFGGVHAKYNKTVNSVQVYNTKLNSCTDLRDPMPRDEAELGAALFKNYFILLGKKSCFLYNFDAETWEVRDQFKTDVEWFGMTVHNEKLFVIGGRYSERFHRDDVRYVPIVNVLNNVPIEWEHHAKLHKPFEVHAFGKLEFLV